ncbi:DUF1800 family protein [Streptomyces sp. RKAG290]|uniref:DUF1800 domain-containing protein n=1 Tax=Streptomyces sp. RKAG290 TaxID=2888348 RepID=UPI002033D29A|nr:DUF1800 family protein [Streptomyces sp. RKAG290]MCM2411081.1 DUF1800 domain-containing protein [Streptomyces sp. RKAG290]
MGRPLDTRAHVMRLLQRTGFDAGPDAVDAAEKAGFDATLDRVLASGEDAGAAATPLPRLDPLPRRGKGGKRDGKKTGGEGGGSGKSAEPQEPGAGQGKDKGDAAAKKAFRSAVREQRGDIALWWLDRMVAAERPWAEKRTLLWHNHWATSVQKVKSGSAMLVQNETLRRLGGGDFRALARAMVCDPALMVWLDAPGSTAEEPNENLGRELMELFVLGVGHYTERDVRQAAAALTGWTVDRKDPDGWQARFRPDRHAVGRHTVVGATEDFTAASLIDHLVDVPASAGYLATRFWGRVVASSAPSKGSLARATAAYGTGRDTTAMFRALLTDPVFADPGSVLVKQPVEYVVGAMRAFGVRPSKLKAPARAKLLRTLEGLGQTPFAPPSVGGWPGGAAWLTGAAAQVRIGFAQGLVREADLTEVERAAAKERPALLARSLGVRSWGAATSGVLTAAARDPHRVTAIALTAPEYLVLA